MGCPDSLARSRTMPSHGIDAGSNPARGTSLFINRKNPQNKDHTLKEVNFLVVKIHASVKYSVMKYYNMETITISKDEYLKLKKKAALADDVVEQLEKSFQDMRKGKVSKWED